MEVGSLSVLPEEEFLFIGAKRSFDDRIFIWCILVNKMVLDVVLFQKVDKR